VDFTKLLEWAVSNGPLGIVAAIAAFLAWLVYLDKKKPEGVNISELKDLIHDYERVTDDYHEVAVHIARSLERLATLLDERTRRQYR
jgi:hypothetical protein